MARMSQTETTHASIDRRSFFKGAGAIGLGVAAAAATGCAPSAPTAQESLSQTGSAPAEKSGAEGAGYYSPATSVNAKEPTDGEVAFEAEPVAADQITETLDCDLLVIGAGIAGICAAASAVQNGLSVVLLEKTSTYQIQAGEIGAVGGKVLDAAGLSADPVEYYNEAMEHASYRCDGDVWQVYIDRSGEAIDWFEDEIVAGACGAWNPSSAADRFANGINWRATVIAPEAGVPEAVGVAFQYCIDHGADVRLETPAVRLVTASDGSVTGAIAKDKDGNYIQVNAPATLLATGGYCHNVQMMQERIRPRDMLCYSWLDARMGDTGDGHLMGLAVGAAEDDFPHAMMNDSSGALSGGAFSCAVLSMMRVNERGERFVNEDLALNFLANTIAYQPGSHDWCLADANVEEMTRVMLGGIEGFDVSGMLDPFMADAVECASVAELASVIGCDEATLQATLDRYNELCEKGADDDFHKTARNMIKIDTPPFYAFEEGPANLSTVNGLRVNAQSQVLNENMEPIAGLYASGNVSGSMFSDTYTHHLAGVSTGRAVTFGYLLGRRLAGVE